MRGSRLGPRASPATMPTPIARTTSATRFRDARPDQRPSTATLAGGGIAAVLGRWSGRASLKRAAVVVLAMGVGIVAGEALGPSREPLITAEGGTMALRLESPVAATATGPAICTNVASATEFNAAGDSNMTLDTPDHPFVSIDTNVG